MLPRWTFEVGQRWKPERWPMRRVHRDLVRAARSLYPVRMADVLSEEKRQHVCDHRCGLETAIGYLKNPGSFNQPSLVWLFL